MTSPLSFRRRLAIVCAASGVYAGAFLLLFPFAGHGAAALTSLPIILGGLLFGTWGGFLAWLLTVPLNMVLFAAVGLGWNILVPGGPIGVLVGLAVGFLVGRFRDLTVSLRQEVAQRKLEVIEREKAEARLGATLAAIPDLIFRIARNGTFLDFHAPNEDELYVPLTRFRSATVGALMPPDFNAQFMPLVEEALRTRRCQSLEYKLEVPRGLQDFEVRIVACTGDEVLTVMRNVTDRKRLEELLRQTERERIEAKMKAQLVVTDRFASLGRLAAGVGHEINNPLAYVIANLTFLTTELDKSPRVDGGAAVIEVSRLREMQDFVRDASEGAERIRVIVRDLKTFTRGSEDPVEGVDVRKTLEFAIGVARKEILSRANLVTDFGEVARVRASQTRLGQVFLNLLINAAQAIPEGAAFRNEVRVVAKMVPGVPGSVLVEVHDTGTGITPEVQERIFDPFFTTKQPGVGSGLGLAISQDIVTALGGTLSVQSEVGRGSVFSVLLPADAGDAERKPGAENAQLPLATRRGRVLVVDDEPAIGGALHRTLGAEHDVVVVTNAKEALEQILSSPFDVILCDLMMPVRTGMDLHADLSVRVPDQCERMVFMTGGAFSPVATAFLEQVPNTRLEKPFNLDALRALVRQKVGT